MRRCSAIWDRSFRLHSNVVLVVTILGYFGLETTSFAALLATVGIAIGAAWGGLLANFAAGAFLIILRPFKVGDYVEIGGVEGSVTAIGIFATTIDSADNVQATVGNNKIFSENIRNCSANPWRRVDRLAQLAHGVDLQDAVTRLRAAVAGIPNVVEEPAPDVKSSTSPPWAPCSRYVSTVTTASTGRCTSTPTGPSQKPSGRRATPCPSSTCGSSGWPAERQTMRPGPRQTGPQIPDATLPSPSAGVFPV